MCLLDYILKRNIIENLNLMNNFIKLNKFQFKLFVMKNQIRHFKRYQPLKQKVSYFIGFMFL